MTYGGGEEPEQQTAHTSEPDDPFWHHVMDHTFEISGTIGIVLVALFGYLGIRKKMKK